MSLARKARRHWLLLIAVAALVVAATVAFWPVDADASHGGFYWQGGYDYTGKWVNCLHSGTTHRALYCY